jgi:hypothetical protein
MLQLAGNVNRAVQRHDPVATQTYVSWFLQVAMRTGFLLRRRYAPYCKWLYKAFQGLPGVSPPLIASIGAVASQVRPGTVMDQLYEILDAIGTMANESGLIEPLPLRKKSPFGWTDFNSYGFTQAFHQKLRGPLRETDPYEHGPLDLQAANGPLNRETMLAAWKTMKKC